MPGFDGKCRNDGKSQKTCLFDGKLSANCRKITKNVPILPENVKNMSILPETWWKITIKIARKLSKNANSVDNLPLLRFG